MEVGPKVSTISIFKLDKTHIIILSYYHIISIYHFSILYTFFRFYFILDYIIFDMFSPSINLAKNI